MGRKIGTGAYAGTMDAAGSRGLSLLVAAASAALCATPAGAQDAQIPRSWKAEIRRIEARRKIRDQILADGDPAVAQAKTRDRGGC